MVRLLAATVVVLVILGLDLVRPAPTVFAGPLLTVPSPLTVGQSTTATGGGVAANSTGFVCLIVQTSGNCEPGNLFTLTADASGNFSYSFTVPNFPGQQIIGVNFGGLKSTFTYTINPNGTPTTPMNGALRPRVSYLGPGQVPPADFFSFPGAGGMQFIVPIDKNFSRYGPGTSFFPQGYVSQGVVPRPQQWFGDGPGISSANNGGFNQNPYGDPLTAPCYGLGTTQNIDAAALELYQNYRNIATTGDPLGCAPSQFGSVPFNLIPIGTGVNF
jgi:hypothetical protein